MGHYKRNENQKGTKPKHARYDFYLHHGGKPYRATRICKRIEVEKLFSAWESSILYGESFSLYDKFDEYLQVKAIHKATYGQEVLFFKTVKAFWGNIDYRKITRSDITKFSDWRLSQGLKPASINREIAVLSVFFNWLILQDLYDKINPCHLTKLKENNQRMIQLKPEQIREIAKKSIRHEISTPVTLALFAGMRKKEILTLKVEDIDLTHRRINIRAGMTKSKKSRSIPMPDILYEHLARHYSNLKERLSITKDKLRCRWIKLSDSLSFGDELSVHRLTFHDLRHVYAQMLRDSGVALQDIQAFLGHASVTTTEGRYAPAGGFNALEKVNKIRIFFTKKKKKK